MKHVAIFENWMREEEIILTSRQGRTIRVKSVHGKIEEIDNEADVRFPFVTGQPITVFMKSWACTNGFKWNGKSPCPEEKVFGIRKKDIPMGHELRMMFPNKFRNESLDSMSILEISNGAIPDSELTVLNKPTGEKGDPKLRLNSKAAIDFNNMVAAAKLEGVNIEVSQGYRDLGSKERGCADGFTQWCAWNKYKAGTGNLAAKPGTSNHGKGSAVDVKNCRKGGAVHNWLKINASKFNFRPLASEAWHWDHSSSRESIISSLDLSNTSSTTTTPNPTNPTSAIKFDPTEFNFNEIPDKKNNWRSAQITADLLPYVIEKYGIKNVIRMNGDGDDSKHRSKYPETSKSTEEQICKDKGCTFNFINSHDGFKSGEGYAVSIKKTSDILKQGNTLIHCAHGADRTGGMVAAYLKNSGYMTDKDQLWKYTTQYNGWQNRVNNNNFFGSGYDKYADGFYPITDLKTKFEKRS